MNESINLKEMKDQEILELMHEDLYDGYSEEILEEVDELLERGLAPYRILQEGLIAGMDTIGEDFRDGIIFVPEVLMSANAMKGGMRLLRPFLAASDVAQQGTVVIGTVKGDIHDIGKNLVGMMLEGAGFEVIDIGINIEIEGYLEAIQEHHPDILGMSALLTTTMPYMGDVIHALKEEGIRDDLIVLVGGAPLNHAFAKDIEADAYAPDAAAAAKTAKAFMDKKWEGE
jgi:corrinoid protein of di/trimethylamine methyltransferase